MGGKQPRKSQASRSLPRRPTPRSIMREIYRQADLLPSLKPIRKSATNFQRELQALGVSERIAKNLSFGDVQEQEAELSGLPAGRTAGTEPERLVAAWLVTHKYEYGGMGYQFNPSKDWGFQIPLEGGRSASGGGAVADVFLSPQASKTPAGVVIRVNGQYFHQRAENEKNDEAQKLRLISKGYRVVDIFDFEVLNPGRLESRMSDILGSGNKA